MKDSNTHCKKSILCWPWIHSWDQKCSENC